MLPMLVYFENGSILFENGRVLLLYKKRLPKSRQPIRVTATANI